MPATSLILVVDDSPDALALNTAILRHAGYRVATAVTGAEALARVAVNPDLIVLDVMLPDMDGFEVCRRLKADPRAARIPVLHLSGLARGAAERIRGLQGGADGYLVRPVEPAELVASVAALLRIRHAESEQRALFEGARDGIVVADDDGRYVAANAAAAALFGMPPEKIIGRSVGEFTESATAPTWQRLLRGGQAIGELRLLRPDGDVRIVEYSGVANVTPGRHLAILRDVTNRKRLEATTAAAIDIGREMARAHDPRDVARRIVDSARALLAARVAAVYEVSPDSGELVALAVSVEPDDALVPPPTLAPGIGVAGLALSTRTLVATPDATNDPRITVPQDMLDRIRAADVRAALAVPLLEHDVALGVLLVAAGGGREFSEDDARLAQLFAGQAATSLANARLFATQATLLRETQRQRKELERLSRRLVEVQEQERRHIARELHDRIGQTLTALKLALEAAARSRDAAGPTADAYTLVADLLRRVRDLSLELRPALLDDLGLVATLMWHGEAYTRETGIAVDLRHRGLEGRRFGSDIETAAYRIVQEALTNVARHAGVVTVAVRAWGDATSLGVQIEDAGRGFVEHEVDARHAAGVSGMRERAAILGGRLEIETAPGRGVRVTAEFPLGPSGD